MGIWFHGDPRSWIVYISNAFYMVYHLSVNLYTIIHVVFNSWIRFTIEALLTAHNLFSSLLSMYTSLTHLFDLAKQLLICIIVYTESFSLIGAPKYFSLVTLQYDSVFSSLSYVTIWSNFTLVTLQYDWVLHDSQLRYNMGIWSLDELITWITYISFNSIVVFNLILQGANIDTVY
jgi:hypothetical protein